MKLSLNSLVPKPGQHAVFCGINGCGKTTLAEVLLRFRQSVLIFDPKGEIKLPGYQRFTQLKKLVNARPLRAIYAPSLAELEDETQWDRFYEYGFRRKTGIGTTIYTDEVYHVTNKTEIPRWYKFGLTRGRSKRVEMWSSTQRPTEVPNFLFSESKHFYCFKLILATDREKVEKMTRIDRDAILDLPERFFYYARADGFLSQALTLNLEKEH